MVIGLIIPNVNWNTQPWLKGLKIAELPEFPIMIFCAIPGTSVGLPSARFIIYDNVWTYFSGLT